MDTSREHAAGLDARDPLARFRDEFLIADPELLYLDGNSLGRLPTATLDFMQTTMREAWGEGLVRSWEQWIDWGQRLGDRTAAAVLGARPGEVVLGDSTSVNLYKLASAALDAAPERRAIVVDTEDFPTNRYLLQGLSQQRGRPLRTVPSPLDGGLDLGDLRDAMGDDTAVVVLSLVSYRSGARLDMAAVNRLVREAGASVVWDLSHAAGAVPIDLHGSGADFAVGCTYKYMNGGPGSPALLYVRSELQPRLRQPLWGWYGQRDQFQMGATYDPVERIERFLISTPPVLSMAGVEPALDILERAGMMRVWGKGRALSELTMTLADAWLVPLGFRIASPRDPDERGLHVSLEHEDASRICRALRARAKVICDYRVPDRLRIGPSPLYTRFVDVWDAMARIRELVARGVHRELPREEVTRVT